MEKIAKLVMVEHWGKRMNYHGFTVLPGHNYGIAILKDGKRIPAFCSGWCCNKAIMLYTKNKEWKGKWREIVCEPAWKEDNSQIANWILPQNLIYSIFPQLKKFEEYAMTK